MENLISTAVNSEVPYKSDAKNTWDAIDNAMGCFSTLWEKSCKHIAQCCWVNSFSSYERVGIGSLGLGTAIVQRYLRCYVGRCHFQHWFVTFTCYYREVVNGLGYNGMSCSGSVGRIALYEPHRLPSSGVKAYCLKSVLHTVRSGGSSNSWIFINRESLTASQQWCLRRAPLS